MQNLTILLICLDNAETRSIIKLSQKTLQDVISLVTSRSLQSFSSKSKTFENKFFSSQLMLNVVLVTSYLESHSFVFDIKDIKIYQYISKKV